MEQENKVQNKGSLGTAVTRVGILSGFDFFRFCGRCSSRSSTLSASLVKSENNEILKNLEQSEILFLMKLTKCWRYQLQNVRKSLKETSLNVSVATILLTKDGNFTLQKYNKHTTMETGVNVPADHIFNIVSHEPEQNCRQKNNRKSEWGVAP